ncbi:DUF2726 domain-containing protein [Plesiomonas shigelloides]|uniref:DUF2726 domain-containing protein n=1 Tax=Plesiomonas shigelloides TaxID=703 RepID=UPI000A0F8066|nr:DUF2726 domain-containing protein [Plesiomonas shigelloides]
MDYIVFFLAFCVVFVFLRIKCKRVKNQDKVSKYNNELDSASTDVKEIGACSFDSNAEQDIQSYRKTEHSKQTHLATENERKLYFALQRILPSEYIIHCQVSLMALVKPIDFRDNSKTWAKRMDFVITDRASKILAVIELDDSSHNAKKRQDRDRYVNDALSGHHPLVRIQTRRYYEPAEIAEIISNETSLRCNHIEKGAA